MGGWLGGRTSYEGRKGFGGMGASMGNGSRNLGGLSRLGGGMAGAGLIGLASGCGVGQQPSAQSAAPVTVHALLDPSLITLFGETAPVIPTFKEANPKVTLD